MRRSPCVRADETGWRIGGRSAWLHALVGNHATKYLIRRSRGADVPAEVIGYDYEGLMLTDGWAPYERFTKAVRASDMSMVTIRSARGWPSDFGEGRVFTRSQLIAAHGNSIRALIKHLDGISDADIVHLNIPNGIPLVYEFDDAMKPLRRYYLGDAAAAEAAAAAVASQGKA